MKAFKVMLPLQVGRELLKPLQIQWLRYPGRIGSAQRAPVGAIQDSITVELADGRVEAMKLSGRQISLLDHDVLRGESIDSLNDVDSLY